MSKLRPGDYETIPPGPTAAAAEALYAASAQRLATATMASLAAADDFELPGGGRLKPRGVSSDSFERRVVKEKLRTSGITGGGSRTRKTSRYNSNSPGGPPRLRLVSRSPGHTASRGQQLPPHPGACPFTGCRPRALLYHAAPLAPLAALGWLLQCGSGREASAVCRLEGGLTVLGWCGRPAGAWGNAAPAPKRRAAKSAATAAAPPPKKKIAKAIAVEKVVLATNIDPTGVGRGGHNAKPKKPIEQHKNRSAPPAPAHRTPKHVAANGCNWGLRH